VGILVPGLLAGSIFSLSAVALVLVYRTTGILNFAQGAIGMLGTFTFVALNRVLPGPLALLMGLATAAALGALLALATAPLRDRLQATVLTLGALGLLQAIAQLVFGGHPVAVAQLFPVHPLRIGGAIVGTDVLLSGVAAPTSTSRASRSSAPASPPTASTPIPTSSRSWSSRPSRGS
jgi:branched-subunit amino acid ABC-type transport system permease component